MRQILLLKLFRESAIPNNVLSCQVMVELATDQRPLISPTKIEVFVLKIHSAIVALLAKTFNQQQKTAGAKCIWHTLQCYFRRRATSNCDHLCRIRRIHRLFGALAAFGAQQQTNTHSN